MNEKAIFLQKNNVSGYMDITLLLAFLLDFVRQFRTGVRPAHDLMSYLEKQTWNSE